ncbi:hypothetical protein M3204_04600 [Mesobacillus subterraneus]|uniref:hypothetical protein n=1 Tax=Mesobacillus subterraneus TaxID=285983 RepID=UPI0020407C59|nr:hypothetical protein [Mesobacillus subterraneus]MCM3663670.1 hypothetical protein [Mesobacillus subterraneus]MCM3683435.1 hypothetical protein [Mesobacillus subterraneus]
MAIKEIFDIILGVIGLLLSAQFAFALTILLLGNMMIEYYEWGTYEKTETKYQKTVNGIMGLIIGIGPFFYKRFIKYNWFLRKLIMLGFLLLMGITSILVYQFIKWVLFSLIL